MSVFVIFIGAMIYTIILNLHFIREYRRRNQFLHKIEGVDDVKTKFWNTGAFVVYHGKEIRVEGRNLNLYTMEARYNKNLKPAFNFVISTESKGSDRDFLKENITEIQPFLKKYGLVKAARRKNKIILDSRLEVEMSKTQYVIKGIDYINRENFSISFVSDGLKLIEILEMK
jgi:hypothetical protein